MRLSDFEAMVRRLADEVPADFLEGIAEIAVSPLSVTHTERAEIYTLGECIPLPSSETPIAIQPSYRAARRRAPGSMPPTHIGGRGRWIGACSCARGAIALSGAGAGGLPVLWCASSRGRGRP